MVAKNFETHPNSNKTQRVILIYKYKESLRWNMR